MGNNLIIQAFTDAYLAGSVDDRKSNSGATFYLGGCLVSWLSKKKTSISLSRVEACTGPPDGCTLGGVEVCTSPQDGCVSGGVTLCH